MELNKTQQQTDIDLAIDAVMECSIQHYDAMASLVAETGDGRGHPSVIRAYNQLVAAHADYIEALNAVAPQVVEKYQAKTTNAKGLSNRGVKSRTKQGRDAAKLKAATRPSRAKKVLDMANLNPVDCGELG